MHIVLFHFYSDKPNPVYQEIAAGLRRRGHQVWLGAPNRHGDLEWHDGSTVIATLAGPESAKSSLARRWSYWRFMWRVRAFLIKAAPDIIQINPTMLAWAVTLWLPPRIHCILDIRQINEAVDASLLTRLKEKYNLLTMQIDARYFFDHTCFCHQEAARRILGKGWAARASVVPVGIDPAFLQYNHGPVMTPPDAVVTGSSPGKDKVRFVYIGSLNRLRNLQLLLAAARLLKERNIDFQLDLIGPDQADGYYHQLVEAWQIGDVAAVVEPIPYEEVPARLLEYDVGVAYVPDRPTWHYQPTIKVLEYRALGMPILSTDVATHREVVEVEVNGLLVADTVESIAAAMTRFATDRDFLSQCRANAQKMRSGTTWAEVVNMYDENVYQKLLNQR